MHRLSLMGMAGMVRCRVGNRLAPKGRSSENGTVAVIVGIILANGVLLGLGAIVMDTGSLLSERRQLQNGADSTSLAVAQMCAASAGCAADLSAGSALTALAGRNAADNRMSIDSVCGSASARTSNPSLTSTTCSGTSTGQLVDCPTVSSTFASARYVEVRTSTRNADGSLILPPILAQTLAGGYSGETVRACARAAWGPPSSVTATLPITISNCEYNAYTSNGTSLQAPGPYATYPLPTGFPYEHAIFYHTESVGPLSCPQGPSGADAPGGFGYLVTSGCNATVSATGTVAVRPGNPSNTALGCDFTPLLSATTGEPVFMPIYNDISGGNYTLDGVAAFWLTGFSTSGNRHASDASGRSLCTPSQTCLYGWFTSDVIPHGSFGGGGGTPRGAIAVGVAG